ncbi:hypothetical protein D4M54_19435 [Klebsiella pneumoniae]|nr:hypothetical protein D4M54_19435 [Klebsiella pneumoniae]HBY4322771.1 hypothetical protein [Klebsiella pneumoniae]
MNTDYHLHRQLHETFYHQELRHDLLSFRQGLLARDKTYIHDNQILTPGIPLAIWFCLPVVEPECYQARRAQQEPVCLFQVDKYWVPTCFLPEANWT